MSGQFNTLTLKWGTLKAWDFTGSEKAIELIQRWSNLGVCASAALQRNTDEQKQLICQIIDECNDPRGIYLSWNDVYVSKEEAKKYVLDYEKEKA
jgi:hypothetical protein